jgi:hypothetical protein
MPGCRIDTGALTRPRRLDHRTANPAHLERSKHGRFVWIESPKGGGPERMKANRWKISPDELAVDEFLLRISQLEHQDLSINLSVFISSDLFRSVFLVFCDFLPFLCLTIPVSLL